MPPTDSWSTPRTARWSPSAVSTPTLVNNTSALTPLAKGALSAAIRTIALDYAGSGVQFNIVAPGPMRAGLFERHLASADNPERFLATREKRQPRGRITGVDEVAQAALFLAQPRVLSTAGRNSHRCRRPHNRLRLPHRRRNLLGEALTTPLGALK
jgi:NAD(P)-dependent dehydrogenase (short-subunit alcohol dehydrogenase family)